MGVWHEGLIGPYFFEETVFRETYHQMLDGWLLPRLRNFQEYREGGLIVFYAGRRASSLALQGTRLAQRIL